MSTTKNAAKPRSQEVAERFPRDVAKHQMEIIRDDGVYRHVKFHNPECSFNQWFELVTWPGVLCYHGGMGTYAFSRITDMFAFFRQGGEGINLYYWSQKCIAEDRYGKIKEYSHDEFVSVVRESADEWADGMSEDEKKRFLAAVEKDVIRNSDDMHEVEAVRRSMEFRWNNQYPFQDFWERGCKVPSRGFLWCCHAIVWGIAKYDAARELQTV